MATTGERLEILRDHFDECFKHFAARFNAKKRPGSKGLKQTRKPIADFCGVGDSTVQRWLADPESITIGGTVGIKLKCFLDMIGYRIIEFERLPPVLRNFSELLGFGIISPEDAAGLLGYTKYTTLYPVLSQIGRDCGYSEEKSAKMYEVWKEKRADLEHAKKIAAKHYRLDFLNPKPAQELVLMPPPAVTGDVVARRLAVLTLLDVSLVFLKEGLLDELSEEELAKLKEAHGSNILELSGRLSTLSSRIVVIKEEKG